MNREGYKDTYPTKVLDRDYLINSDGTITIIPLRGSEEPKDAKND